MQLPAGARAEERLHPLFVRREGIARHKCLHAPGKAAAVHTHGTLALQVMLGGRNGHAHFLMLLVPGGDHILQVLPAAVAGSGDQLQEGVKVAAAQSSHLLGNPVALIVINQILMLVGEMMHIDMSDITNIDAIIDGIIKKKEAK